MRNKLLPFVLGFLLILPGCATLDVFKAPPPPLQISFVQAYQYAELSNASYQDEEHIKDVTGKYGFHVIKLHINQNDSVNYFIAKKKNEYLISARGTASISDVLTDIKFKLIPNQSLAINIHTGFDQAAKEIANEVREIIPIEAIVHTTGHSLGGAMAVAVAFYLKNEGYTVSQVVTFGQPRVTDYLGSQKYAGLAITRYVSEKDIVPMIPPILADFKSGGIYWHLGNEVLLQDNGDYLSLNNHQSIKRALHSTVANFVTERDLSAHKMENYLRLIQLAAD